MLLYSIGCKQDTVLALGGLHVVNLLKASSKQPKLFSKMPLILMMKD